MIRGCFNFFCTLQMKLNKDETFKDVELWKQSLMVVGLVFFFFCIIYGFEGFLLFGVFFRYL